MDVLVLIENKRGIQLNKPKKSVRFLRTDIVQLYLVSLHVRDFCFDLFFRSF